MSALVNGFQHVATVTNDLDRLMGFYEEVFDAETRLVLPIGDEAPATRHALIELSPGVVLHPFERPTEDLDQWGIDILERGRLDHFAIRAADEEGFEKLRERLVARGASDGTITDFGPMQSVGFDDPDGTRLEVCYVRTDVPIARSKEPEGFQPYRRAR